MTDHDMQDSADLVEREQWCDGQVEMLVDFALVNGYLTCGNHDLMLELFVEALEIDCALAARWAHANDWTPED